MAFTVWYGYFMFPLIFGFEGKEAASISLMDMGAAGTEEEEMFARLIKEQTSTTKTDLGNKLIEQPYIQGRFHHIGFELQHDKASTCVRCHGNVPHDESKELRSFLNMHTFYLACETCHVSDKDESDRQFRWYNKDNGELVPNPVALRDIEELYRTKSAHIYPTYGNYGAKIVPGKKQGELFVLTHGPKEMAFADRYIEEQERLGPEQKSQMKKVIHRKVSSEPITCKQCHDEKEQYLPLAELGYPPTRLSELTDSSVVGMILKYREFYIPRFLTPGVEHNENK
jgi:hypothetical protein